jgi:endoribonuclease Dicer
MEALRQIVKRPYEEMWTYSKLEPPFATKMYTKLQVSFGKAKSLEPVFKFAWAASSELGEWCADQVWIQALREDVIPHLERSTGKHPESDPCGTDQIRNDLMSAKEACERVKNHEFRNPLDGGQLSSKVRLLIARLAMHFDSSDDKKCIVFTQRRNTAKVLLRLCEVMKIRNLRPGILVGVRKSDITGNVTFRHQFEVRGQFQDGKVNCLFATAVAEEGLDIPDCNFVVRFDLYDTLIQYIQSRGRARHAESTYVTMVEDENESQKRKVQEVREAEVLMRSFCQALPKDRLLCGNDCDLDLKAVLAKQKGQRTYKIESTGATLTYGHAIDVLGRYAASLQYQEEDFNQNQNQTQTNIGPYVSYMMHSEGEKFSCEVTLPEKSLVRGVLGTLESSKAMAKGSAAFDTCLVLRKSNLLDGHFRPIFHRRLPAMRNARLAIASKKQEKYDRRCKPSHWSHQIGTIPTELYAILIRFNPLKPLNREHAPLILLTRTRLPSFPSFPIFLDDDIETRIQTLCVESPLAVSSQQLDQLTDFTVSVFRDVFHKVFESKPEVFPYWLAPAHLDADIGSPTELPNTLIDWEASSFVHEHREWKWSEGMDPKTLLNRFMYDPWSGKFRYFPLSIVPDLSALDAPPSYVPRRRDINMQNIMNYSLSLYKGSRHLFLQHCNWDQPVLQAEMVGLRRNFLDRGNESERPEKTLCVLCPETVMLSAVGSASVHGQTRITYIDSCSRYRYRRCRHAWPFLL